ncbi:hypothetical protein [Kitasatospora sp. NPDC058190]|uniref:hypothetical protein n=1 Tax=Kitasatospora sp. NPDC058190 TaxID=3346371 RepID=UPI0036D77A57
MSASIRTKFARFLAVPALATVGVALATAPAHAGTLSIGVNSAVVADAGQTLNVSVTYRCLADFQFAAITVQASQAGTSGRGSVHVPCTGVLSTATVPVSAASPDGAWTKSPVDLSAYIADAELTRARTTATVVAG